jgi:hypothetical protein
MAEGGRAVILTSIALELLTHVQMSGPGYKQTSGRPILTSAYPAPDIIVAVTDFRV